MGYLFYNVLGQGFDIFDFDNNSMDWAKRESKRVLGGDSPGAVNISVNPLLYTKSILEYLETPGVKADTAYLYKQVRNEELDTLNKYTANLFDASLSGPVWINSTRKKLSRSEKALSMSKIVFAGNNVAFVKIHYLSRRRDPSANASEIVVLKKAGTDWHIDTILTERDWAVFFR